MDSSKSRRWTCLFKNFSRVRVHKLNCFLILKCSGKNWSIKSNQTKIKKKKNCRLSFWVSDRLSFIESVDRLGSTEYESIKDLNIFILVPVLSVMSSGNNNTSNVCWYVFWANAWQIYKWEKSFICFKTYTKPLCCEFINPPKYYHGEPVLAKIKITRI